MKAIVVHDIKETGTGGQPGPASGPGSRPTSSNRFSWRYRPVVATANGWGSRAARFAMTAFGDTPLASRSPISQVDQRLNPSCIPRAGEQYYPGPDHTVCSSGLRIQCLASRSYICSNSDRSRYRLPRDYEPARPAYFEVARIHLARGSLATSEGRRFVECICTLYPEARVEERLDTTKGARLSSIPPPRTKADHSAASALRG